MRGHNIATSPVRKANLNRVIHERDDLSDGGRAHLPLVVTLGAGTGVVRVAFAGESDTWLESEAPVSVLAALTVPVVCLTDDDAVLELVPNGGDGGGAHGVPSWLG